MTWDDLPELLRRARNGDDDAWRAVVALAEPFLLGQAGKVLGPRWPQQSTSDLIQETWQRAWQGLHEFRGGPTPADTAAMFRAWLARILHSQWHNCVRGLLAKKRAPEQAALQVGQVGDAQADLPDPGPRPSVLVRRRERAAEAHAALSRLDQPRDRDVLRLYFYDGLSFRQIAEELGITLDQVRTSYHRGLERLKDLKRLEDLLDSLS